MRARAQVIKMFDHCKRHLKHGNPLVFFPEGTRSTDGSIKQFKPGAFSLALETQVVLFLAPFWFCCSICPVLSGCDRAENKRCKPKDVSARLQCCTSLTV